MQLPILRAVAMVVVGNAALDGSDVSSFARSSLFRYAKQTAFVTPRGGDQHEQIAADPVAWFAWLKAQGCGGLRLHTAPMEQKPGRLGTIEERMLVGFVGGGPRWLIEAVGKGAAQLWEGFDRVGDANDSERRIWMTTFVRVGETAPQDEADANVSAAAAELEAALTDIGALAHMFASAPFDAIFDEARSALHQPLRGAAAPDFLRLAHLDAEATRLLQVCERAWVFGGMGSWNDTGPDAALNDAYERTSEALFQALVRALIAVANSSYRG